MGYMFTGILLALLATGHCFREEEEEEEVPIQYTITDEVHLDFLVEDLGGRNEDYRGSVVIGVFGDVTPLTALNFVSIARGYQVGNHDFHYKGTRVHRLVRDFVMQMGDVTSNDGHGGASIYGPKFNDENFLLSHRSGGWVAMANSGPDTNQSQFFILMTKAKWLDGKHVVFGKVIRGWDVLENINENVPSDPQTGEPRRHVLIENSSVKKLDKKFTLPDAKLDSTDDLFID